MLDTRERPPYVMFENRAVVDRAASEASGHVAYKDVAFALITPAGSRDCVEKEAEVWLDQIERQAQTGNYPVQWPANFRAAYELWKRGEEVPANGTALKAWPQITPAEILMCKGANVLTVEDLAAANEQTIQRIGMSGRVLKNKAEMWLKASEGGRFSEQMANLQEENRRQAEIIDQMAKKIDLLQSQMGGDGESMAPRRGRPPKDREAA